MSDVFSSCACTTSTCLLTVSPPIFVFHKICSAMKGEGGCFYLVGTCKTEEGHKIVINKCLGNSRANLEVIWMRSCYHEYLMCIAFIGKLLVLEGDSEMWSEYEEGWGSCLLSWLLVYTERSATLIAFCCVCNLLIIVFLFFKCYAYTISKLCCLSPVLLQHVWHTICSSQLLKTVMWPALYLWNVFGVTGWPRGRWSWILHSCEWGGFTQGGITQL